MCDFSKSIHPYNMKKASTSTSMIMIRVCRLNGIFRGFVWLKNVAHFHSLMEEQFVLGIITSALEFDTSYTVYLQFISLPIRGK